MAAAGADPAEIGLLMAGNVLEHDTPNEQDEQDKEVSAP